MRSNISGHTRTRRIFLPILIFSLLLFAGTAAGEDWQFFSRYKDNFYYDKESITYPVKNYTRILSLWQKIVYEKESAFRIAEELGDKYSDVHESLHLIELHCKRKEVYVRSISYYDSSGKIIDYSYTAREDWKPILADTPFEDLFWRVCPHKNAE